MDSNLEWHLTRCIVLVRKFVEEYRFTAILGRCYVRVQCNLVCKHIRRVKCPSARCYRFPKVLYCWDGYVSCERSGSGFCDVFVDFRLENCDVKLAERQFEVHSVTLPAPLVKSNKKFVETVYTYDVN